MFAELENAIVQRLTDAAKQLEYRVQTIESFGGQLAIDEAGRPVAKATFNLPALFVVLGDFKLDGAQGERAATYHQDVIVYCCTYNVHNERAQRVGDKHEVGSYQLSEDVAQLLSNQRCGQQIKPLRLTEINSLFSAANNDAKAMSVRAVHFRTTVKIAADYPEGVELADVLLGINNGFYLPDTTAPGHLQAEPALGATFNA